MTRLALRVRASKEILERIFNLLNCNVLWGLIRKDNISRSWGAFRKPGYTPFTSYPKRFFSKKTPVPAEGVLNVTHYIYIAHLAFHQRDRFPKNHPNMGIMDIACPQSDKKISSASSMNCNVPR
ncbi:hypothetical protein AVEN_265457-1 [Araneus ventricosus]|uniref:Uncharacterized protein n=1 Tax=Araneus ventricosus TaxID=182803 RepID=A0A4Y2CHI7_ARAVE|nr:hypothetical protein AVEN_265457-1 [Araneus ventricosus]